MRIARTIGFVNTLALAVVGVALLCPPARAALLPPVTIEAPSSQIVELSDSALSQDGSGGVVWVKRVDNVRHVFAAVLRNREWSRPMRIDVGQSYDSYVPRIGAGDGGRVVVTWVQKGPAEPDPEQAPRHDQLYSSTLDPGAAIFEPPVPIDLDVGSQDGVYPDLVMNRDGKAFIVYRVITNVMGAGIPEGYVKADLKAARYNGWTWSRLDQVLDRNPSVLVPTPTADNASRVAIDRLGSALVAFQEPDDEFIDRVWLRRIFSGSMSLPLKVSPDSWAGSPLRGAADQIALASGPFGNAAIAFRQRPGNPSALDRTRAFVNLLPDIYSENANLLAGARPADTSGGTGPEIEGVGVAVTPRQRFVSLFGLAGTTLEAEGSDDAPAVVKPIGEGVASATQPAVAIAADERRSMAWIAGQAENQSVVLREADATGDAATAVVTSPVGGAVHELRFAGTNYADGLAAFRQGDGAQSGIYAAVADSRPTAFAVFEPEGWIRSKQARVEWDPSFDGLGGAAYRIKLDGAIAGTTRDAHFELPTKVRDGRHSVTVTATDELGQERAAVPVAVRLDRRKPMVTIRRSGRRGVRVVIRDGRRGRVSGPSARSRVRWGDGRSARISTKKTYKFKRSGNYRLIIRAVDRAGNVRVVRRSIRLR